MIKTMIILILTAMSTSEVNIHQVETHGQNPFISKQIHAFPSDTFELKTDEEGLTDGYLHEIGERLAVKHTPPSYPFTVIEAAYASRFPGYDEECKIIFYTDGVTGPGSVIAQKNVSLDYAWLRWVDISDLNIKIESGSFYVAIELLTKHTPMISYDCLHPVHHVSWTYTGAMWIPWENISMSGSSKMLGDSLDMILRVKGLAPGIGIVELGSDREFVLSSSPSIIADRATVTCILPSAGYIEIELWDSTGRKIVELYKGQASEGNWQLQWESSNLPNGTYFICLKQGIERRITKVVVVN